MAAVKKNAAPPSAQSVVAKLERLADKRTLESMSRYGLPSDNALGVPMNRMLALAKELGPNHALAEALWKTRGYEARMVASMIDDPAQVTAAQMDRWMRDFDNWGIVDTVCFKLFDRVDIAFEKAAEWCDRTDEFGRRAGHVLYACLALHGRAAPAGAFERALELIERDASDERNFVRKGVSWSLRSIGRRAAYRAAALDTARRLAAASNATARWIGKGAVKELEAIAKKPKAKKRLAARKKKSP
jgi:3-methyladenine DNA glycosylase AlkD